MLIKHNNHVDKVALCENEIDRVISRRLSPAGVHRLFHRDRAHGRLVSDPLVPRKRLSPRT